MSGSTSRHTPSRPGVARTAGDGIGAAHGIWPLPSAGHPVQSQAPAPDPPPCRHGENPPAQERLLLALPSWARAFPGTARQATTARRFVSGLLDGSPFRDDAVLVLSELFTNAILHSDSGKPGGLVIVQISRWLLGVRIAVTDQGSHNQPVIPTPAHAATWPRAVTASTWQPSSPGALTGTTTLPDARSPPCSAGSRLSITLRPQPPGQESHPAFRNQHDQRRPDTGQSHHPHVSKGESRNVPRTPHRLAGRRTLCHPGCRNLLAAAHRPYAGRERRTALADCLHASAAPRRPGAPARPTGHRGTHLPDQRPALGP